MFLFYQDMDEYGFMFNENQTVDIALTENYFLLQNSL